MAANPTRDFDDPVSNTSANETFEEVLNRRFSRRTLLRGAAGAAPLFVLGTSLFACSDDDAAPSAQKAVPIGFQPITANNDDKVTVPPGYEAQVVIRWGDPVKEGSPTSSAQLLSMTPEQQAARFGYDPDWVGYFALKDYKSTNANAGLLAVNHENVMPGLMFNGFDAANPTKAQVDVEMAAHGLTILEIARDNNKWTYKVGSPNNRRLTASTPMEITGPAAGNDKLRTSADATGTKVLGMLNNCGGGKTPWGTILTCEENFNGYFANLNDLPDSDPRKAIHKRYGVTAAGSSLGWEKFYDRFNVVKDPNESFRHGWVVEIDPYEPNSTPKKRTALGRAKHEAATVVLSKEGRAVVYSGDDERFDYVYKFVSVDRVDTKNRAANADLLDRGTLYAAKFNDNGSGEWLALIQGQGQLTAANGFVNQGDVMINTRGAADLLGATKMDRPEDVEASPITGKVYAVMTNNTNRTVDQLNRANPRAANKHGHIIEFTEAGDDAAARSFTWDVFIQAGDPTVAADNTYFAGFDEKKVAWLSSPDNIVFGAGGNMWIATDGQPNTLKSADSLYVVPVDGEERGYLRRFLTGPVGCEICGPEFTPDFTTLFAAIQHPGDSAGSTLETPGSRWPDNASPPRGSIVAIVKTGAPDAVIGS